MAETQTLSQRWNQYCENYSKEYKALLTANSGIWIIYALKFMESYAYFTLSYTQVLFLTEEFGFTDIEASWIYGIQVNL